MLPLQTINREYFMDVIDFGEAKRNRIGTMTKKTRSATKNTDERDQGFDASSYFIGAKYLAMAKEMVAITERCIEFSTISELIQVIGNFGCVGMEHKILLEGIVDAKKLELEGISFTAKEIAKIRRKGTVSMMSTKAIVKEHPNFTPKITDAVIFGWIPEYLDAEEYDSACEEEFGSDVSE